MIRTLKSFFAQKARLQEFLRYLTQDHEIKVGLVVFNESSILLFLYLIPHLQGDDAEDLADKVLNAVRRRGHGTEDLQQDMGVYVLKLLQASGKQWPVTVGPSFALLTNSFSVQNAQLLKGTFPPCILTPDAERSVGLFLLLDGNIEEQCLSAWIQDIMTEYSSVRLSSGEAANAELERHHCTAAEVFAAMV